MNTPYDLSDKCREMMLGWDEKDKVEFLIMLVQRVDFPRLIELAVRAKWEGLTA